MNVTQGIDICNIQRIEKIYQKFGEKFLNKIFTNNEINYSTKNNGNISFSSLAKRFAAKEAFSKAIGEGIGEISFKDIEILNDQNKAPFINNTSILSNYLLQKKKWLEYSMSVSLSDDYPMAIASVIIIINKVKI